MTYYLKRNLHLSHASDIRVVSKPQLSLLLIYWIMLVEQYLKFMNAYMWMLKREYISRTYVSVHQFDASLYVLRYFHIYYLVLVICIKHLLSTSAQSSSHETLNGTRKKVYFAKSSPGSCTVHVLSVRKLVTTIRDNGARILSHANSSMDESCSCPSRNTGNVILHISVGRGIAYPPQI